MIVIIVVLSLVAVILPGIGGIREKAKRNIVRSDLVLLKESIHAYYMKNGYAPKSLDALQSEDGLLKVDKIPKDAYSKSSYVYSFFGENKYFIVSDSGKAVVYDDGQSVNFTDKSDNSSSINIGWTSNGQITILSNKGFMPKFS